MDIREQLASALGDRYRVDRELGRGGMAVVFLAEDLKHHRRVAIKLLKPELSAVIGSERFLREIEIAATLQHPHILPLYDSGAVPARHPESAPRAEQPAPSEARGGGGEGLPRAESRGPSFMYYVMPFAEGESLRQRLAREVQLPLEIALQITRDVGSALQYAHEHGVIHRDIKPENIMLSGGHAVVADFGIARVLGAANADHLTVSGMSVGTPQYMSPEQASAGVVDARSDQYSLACTLYEMLAGQPPFVGPSSQAVIARHLVDPVPSLRVVRQTVPKPTEAAIVQAMAKLPADRFPSIERFLNALSAPTTADQLSAVPAGRPRAVGARGRRALVMALGAGALTAAIWWVAAGRPQRTVRTGSPAIRSVAVLPFQDLTSSPDSSYLRDGMTDGLTADLAQIQSLKVLSRASASMAPGDSGSVAQVARELGVDAVVKGSIRRSGDTVWVSVRFLHGPDSTVLFTKDYERRLGELPNLQREITTAITASISTNLDGAERSRLASRREVDHRAYEAYLRGRFHLERGELEQSKALFEQARRVAPDWAPPNVGLATYYTSLPFYSDTMPVEVLPRARAALKRALELDETLAEAHAANAYIRAYYEWDWRAAEQEFRRAVQLQPSYADAYFSYSRFLASRRRLDEAIAQLERAVELDPLSLSLQANRALLDYFAGRYDTAATRLQTILKADSTDVLSKWALALVAEQQGKPDQSIAILEPITGASLNRKTALGHAYALARKTAMARGVLRELHQRAAQSYVPAYDFALLYVALGQRDEALRYLERAYAERSTVLAYLMIDPRLASLREEPRFIALTKRLTGE